MQYLDTLVKDTVSPDDVVLTHGTSVEAACALLAKGRMLREDFSRRANEPYPTYLFFKPVWQHFVGHPFRNIWERNLGNQTVKFSTWDACVNSARGSARINGQSHYFVAQTRYISEAREEINLEEYEKFLRGGTFHPYQVSMWQEVVKDLNGLGWDTERLTGLFKEVNRRRGVMIALGKNALKLDLKKPIEEADEVPIHLPGGLEIKYVHAIVPFGQFERKRLAAR